MHIRANLSKIIQMGSSFCAQTCTHAHLINKMQKYYLHHELHNKITIFSLHPRLPGNLILYYGVELPPGHGVSLVSDEFTGNFVCCCLRLHAPPSTPPTMQRTAAERCKLSEGGCERAQIRCVRSQVHPPQNRR